MKNNLFFINKIEKLLKHLKSKEKKDLLISCINNFGFIKQEEQENYENYENYEYFNNNQEEIYDDFRSEQQLEQGVRDRENMSTSTRTFIAPSDNTALKRLYEVQKYTISPDEIDSLHFLEIVENVLNVLRIEENIKPVALNMYTIIKSKKKLIGSFKKGIIVYCIYYAISSFMYIDIMTIVDITGFIKPDLVSSDIFIKEVFDESSYRFIYTDNNERYLCGMKGEISKEEIEKIYQVIKKLQSKNIFNKPATKVQIAGAIKKVTDIKYNVLKQYININETTIKNTLKTIDRFL
jgi:DNA-directed RNA polymerase subunit F